MKINKSDENQNFLTRLPSLKSIIFQLIILSLFAGFLFILLSLIILEWSTVQENSSYVLFFFY